MKLSHNFARMALAGILAFAVAGCASARDRRADNTLIGAGLGAAAGAVLSEGDPLYAIGGAAAGGLLGNLLTEDRSYRSHGWNRGHHYQPRPRYIEKRYYHPKRAVPRHDRRRR